MGDDKTEDKKAKTIAAVAAVGAAMPGPSAVDNIVAARMEDEIETVIDEVLRPYLKETIPLLMRKLNHQGAFEKIVKNQLEDSLKTMLAQYIETAGPDITAKIEKKFKEVVAAEYEPRIEQAAKKLLDDRLARLRQEFAK